MKPFKSERKDFNAHRKEHECPPGGETHHGMPRGEEPKAPEPIVKHVRVNTARQEEPVKKRNWWQIGFNAVAGIALTALGLPQLMPLVSETPQNPPQRTISAPVDPSPSPEVLRLQGQISGLAGQVDTLHDRVSGIKVPDLTDKVEQNTRHIRKIFAVQAKQTDFEDAVLDYLERRVATLEDEAARQVVNYRRR